MSNLNMSLNDAGDLLEAMEIEIATLIKAFEERTDLGVNCVKIDPEGAVSCEVHL